MMEKLKKLLSKEGTGISWCDMTFNPWLGCQRVSPACDACYAATFVEGRLGHMGIKWGPGEARVRTGKSNWMKPRRWNRIAEEAGVRLRVFCASLADVFDNAVDDQWRADLAELIRDTPWLDWMLLTKRIGNARAMLAAMFPAGVPENVAVGVTICNQDEADRDLPKAVATKRDMGIRRLFVSAEPLLQRVSFAEFLADIDLVIVGGESGKGARTMPEPWAFLIRDECFFTSTPFHFKQQSQADYPRTYGRPETFPKGLQIREHFK